MKYLGIDYGSKKTGIAISDEAGNIAFPKEVISTEDLVNKVIDLIKEEDVGAVVLGRSMNLKGKPNMIMKKIEPFKKNLEEKLDITVFFQDEFMTTLESSLSRKRLEKETGEKFKNDPLDASAAAIMLQRFLDKN